MDRIGTRLFALICSVGVVAFVSTSSGQDGTYTNKNMVFPDQGWSAEDRLRYYNTSQGSAALWYDIFLHLENAGDEQLFRSDATMRGYGLVPQDRIPSTTPTASRSASPERRWPMASGRAIGSA